MKSPKSPKISLLARLLDNRLPLIGKFLHREAVVTLVQDGSPEAMEALLHADDHAVYDLTLKAFKEGHPEAVKTYTIPASRGVHQVISMDTKLGLRRSDMRAPRRSEILADWAVFARRDWKRAPSPAETVHNALKTGDLSAFKSAEAEWIGPLLEACNDPDRKVRANLEKFLRHLEKPKSLEALCRKLIEKDYPLAREIAVKRSIAPQDPVARVLFFFMTEQWERYEALDLDRRLLCAAYAAENADVRQRIREKLRATGRSELLTIVIGQESASRIAEMTDDEYEFVISMLSSHWDGGRLWQMLPETTVARSARILEVLAGVGWQPPEAECALFVELCTLLKDGLLLDPDVLPQEFPGILLRGQLRTPGRTADVLFAPLASLSPLSLDALDTFARDTDLEEPVRRLFTYIALIVRYCIRFDVEVEPVPPAIMSGEFDIEL